MAYESRAFRRIDDKRDPNGSPYRRTETTHGQRTQASRPRRHGDRTRPEPRGSMPLTDEELQEHGIMPLDEYSAWLPDEDIQEYDSMPMYEYPEWLPDE